MLVSLKGQRSARQRGGVTKQFLAIYIGTAVARAKSRWDELDAEKREAIETSGIKAWWAWGKAHSEAIVDQGGPVGKTKRVSAEGIADLENNVTGYVVVRAESHEAAAKLFEKHPHFAIFPGDSVEIMELLPVPAQPA